MCATKKAANGPNVAALLRVIVINIRSFCLAERKPTNTTLGREKFIVALLRKTILVF